MNCFSSVHAWSSINIGEFRIYENKRLTSVTSTTLTSSRMECARKCMNTIGCLAVSITTDYEVISCSLVTGPSDVLHDIGSSIFVLGESMITHLNFCLNLNHVTGRERLIRTWLIQSST